MLLVTTRKRASASDPQKRMSRPTSRQCDLTGDGTLILHDDSALDRLRIEKDPCVWPP